MIKKISTLLLVISYIYCPELSASALEEKEALAANIQTHSLEGKPGFGEDNYRPLIIGARPWDENLEGVKGIETAHFVDFLIPPESPKSLPDNFHHYDLNDEGHFGAGKFSDFATACERKFSTIFIDIVTCQHIKRDGVWGDLKKLLHPPFGNLIIPILKPKVKVMTEFDMTMNLDEYLSNKVEGSFMHHAFWSYERLTKTPIYQKIPKKFLGQSQKARVAEGMDLFNPKGRLNLSKGEAEPIYLIANNYPFETRFPLR